MANIVAIDGGGSRCRLAALSADGSVLAQTTVDKHASLSAGVDAAWAHIQLGMAVIRQNLSYPASWWPDTLALGLAGSLRCSRRQALLGLIPEHVSTILVTDGMAQLVGASGNKPGACLAVGTGSVLHWLDHNGESGMAGGWGYPVGDQGSGAWLGMRALQRYIAYVDGQGDSSALVEAVRQKVGDNISALQAWTTQAQASVVAQLAPLVFESAKAGDAVASALLDEAVQCCVQLIDCAPSELPVYVVGGVGQPLKDALASVLGERLQVPRGDALQGLFLLSQQS